MTTEAVQYSKEQSTDIVYKKKKRLAKSGKDMGLGAYCQYITFTALLHPYVKDVTCRGKTLYTPG